MAVSHTPVPQSRRQIAFACSKNDHFLVSRLEGAGRTISLKPAIAPTSSLGIKSRDLSMPTMRLRELVPFRIFGGATSRAISNLR
jgi:hypothetical protein